MKQAVMTDFNTLKIIEREIPKITEGEALIRVLFVGICGSDLHIFEGKHPTAQPPLVLGYEFVGELVEINDRAQNNFVKGDAVTAHPLTSCGVCIHCISGRQNICSDVSIFGVHRDGCYSGYVKVAVDRLVKIDPRIDLQVAALAEPLAGALHDIRRSGLQTGESVFIVGAGPIGILLAIMAERIGAGRIVLSEIDGQRKAFAHRLGFEVLNPVQVDTRKPIAEYMGTEGFQRVFEVTGSREGLSMAIRGAGSGGSLVLVGIPKGKLPLDIVSVVLRELDLKGVRIHSFTNFRDAIEILNKGTINHKLKKLISEVYPFEEVPEVLHGIAKNKSIIKALIRIT